MGYGRAGPPTQGVLHNCNGTLEFSLLVSCEKSPQHESVWDSTARGGKNRGRFKPRSPTMYVSGLEKGNDNAKWHGLRGGKSPHPPGGLHPHTVYLCMECQRCGAVEGPAPPEALFFCTPSQTTRPTWACARPGSRRSSQNLGRRGSTSEPEVAQLYNAQILMPKEKRRSESEVANTHAGFTFGGIFFFTRRWSCGICLLPSRLQA